MQTALAWLLHRSPTILLIPGTSSVAHLRENVAAADVELPDDALKASTRSAIPKALPACPGSAEPPEGRPQRPSGPGRHSQPDHRIGYRAATTPRP